MAYGRRVLTSAPAERIPWTRALAIVVPADAASAVVSGVAVAVRQATPADVTRPAGAVPGVGHG